MAFEVAGDFVAALGGFQYRATPLFFVIHTGQLRVFTAVDPPEPSSGNTV